MERVFGANFTRKGNVLSKGETDGEFSSTRDWDRYSRMFHQTNPGCRHTHVALRLTLDKEDQNDYHLCVCVRPAAAARDTGVSNGIVIPASHTCPLHVVVEHTTWQYIHEQR
jgi:hypothetical protein